MHAYHRRWLATAILLAGLVSVSCKGKVSKATSERATTLAELYSLRSVPTFDINLSSEDIEALRINPKSWVIGDFEYAGKKYGSVSLRLKGHRSMRSIDDKPAIKLRFNKGKDHRGRSFLGVHRVTLNNLVEDPTMIREYLAYQLAREVGLPVPQAGFANIRINGELRGLYLVVETPDKDFLKRQFGSGKGELYEGEYGCDLFVADVDGFEQDRGKKDRNPLRRFAEAAEAKGDEVWRPDGPMTLEHLSLFLAFSTYVGDFDGYHHSHNYRIYRDPKNDTWQFMSWGLDRAFFKSLPPFSSQGLLAKRCYAQADCRKAYLLNLRRVHDA
ncbi:MAG: CotH kinase family protein, partial [Kofleriaceae bacterium]|nr:CotH kinase family protein [Kofleriaceae bacterium]